MYIGALAAATGSTARAIRLYESMQLLQVRRQGKYRVYDQSHVEFVQLIKQAQRLGVQLSELQQLRRPNNQLDWPALHQLLTKKYQALARHISQQQTELQRIAYYQQLIADCVASDLSAVAVCGEELLHAQQSADDRTQQKA